VAIPIRQMEIERVMNLVRALGWELVEQRIGETVLTITIQKRLSAETLGSAGAGPGVPGPS
jgi:hypothetical protein